MWRAAQSHNLSPCLHRSQANGGLALLPAVLWQASMQTGRVLAAPLLGVMSCLHSQSTTETPSTSGGLTTQHKPMLAARNGVIRNQMPQCESRRIASSPCLHFQRARSCMHVLHLPQSRPSDHACAFSRLAGEPDRPTTGCACQASAPCKAVQGAQLQTSQQPACLQGPRLWLPAAVQPSLLRGLSLLTRLRRIPAG